MTQATRILVPWILHLLPCCLFLYIGLVQGKETVPANDTNQTPVVEPVSLREHTTLSGQTMGTSWSVVIADTITSENTVELRQAIEAELHRINKLMSTYDSDSQLSAFNRQLSTSAITLHPDTLKVIAAAHGISESTNGAYDVTLQPVIRLWGFGAGFEGSSIPQPTALREAMALVGYKKLIADKQSIRKTIPGLQIDLSSIAKGFAVDQISAVIMQAGINNFTADIGGELLTRGERADGSHWRIGVVTPDNKQPIAIRLKNAQLASSGDYRNYRIVDSQRYSHIIDGNTGHPITHGTAAVTILHDSVMLADGWATALMVVEPDHAMQLAKEHNLAVQLTIRQEQAFVVYRTDAFKRLLE